MSKTVFQTITHFEASNKNLEFVSNTSVNNGRFYSRWKEQNTGNLFQMRQKTL